MKQLYHIQYWCPQAEMGGAGFNVQLWPAWKEAIASYKPTLDQKAANHVIENIGEEWLKGCGFDPKIYTPRHCIQVTWGEWGPEHISVPGNACGLDMDSGGIGKPRDGRILTPHNVDSIRQASLLLCVFLFFADTLVLDQQIKETQSLRGASGEKAVGCSGLTAS